MEIEVKPVPNGEEMEEDKADYDKMEEWLDKHQNFVHAYFARKATRSMVDGWLIQHAITNSQSLATMAGNNQSQSENPVNSSNSKPNSGANTPMRKISAQEFEKGGLLKPLVSTVDGTPTFLGPSIQTSDILSAKSSRRTKSELKQLDERELLYELVMDICNDLDVTSLCHKILQNVSILVNADRCSLFLVQGEKGSPERTLVSKLFDVNSQTSLQESLDRTEEITIPIGAGIVGYVAHTGEPVNIPDAYKDPRFNQDVDLKTGYKTRSILCMPIKDMEGDVIGVAQSINKISVKDEPFDEHDEKVFSSYLAFCGIGLRNAQLYQRSQLENKRSQNSHVKEIYQEIPLVLLDLARVIFEEQNKVSSLIHKIMMHTQSLLRCERCQVLLVDEASKIKHSGGNTKGIFSQVFDLQASDFDNDDTYNREGNISPRFPINIGITGYVASRGETLNIPDVTKDDRFDAEVAGKSGFKTRSILCMPIKNASGQVIGVSQLINKLDGSPFNKNDENLFEAFSIFCGMGINNTQMYEKALRAMAKQRVALEVLSYHASAPMEEAHKLRQLSIPSAQHLRLLEYSFNDFTLDDDDTLRACIRMFKDLSFLEKFNINYDVFCRWLLSVKKNYRNVTYHNWRHAFNVAQTMYCMLMQSQMNNVLSDLECLALIVGSLCHDLDHRGTNNQFQIKTMSPLAQLYSTSVMEHHHFDHCIMILNSKGNEIFGNLREDQYEDLIRLVEHAILATDLALYFRYRGEFFNLVDANAVDFSKEEHRDLLRSMMMTACDISAITKPWEVQKKVALLVASEFFEQGDIEKTELKIKPIDMFDREKKDQLPTMQVGFIDSICMPVYQAFSKISERFSPLLEGCKTNRERWQEMADLRSKKMANEQSPENENKDLEDKGKASSSKT